MSNQQSMATTTIDVFSGLEYRGNPYGPRRPFGCETKFTSGTKHHVTFK